MILKLIVLFVDFHRQKERILFEMPHPGLDIKIQSLYECFHQNMPKN